jgi:plastocyanin domain-containing protein
MTKREKDKVKTKMDHKHYTKKPPKKSQLEQVHPLKYPVDELIYNNL